MWFKIGCCCRLSTINRHSHYEYLLTIGKCFRASSFKAGIVFHDTTLFFKSSILQNLYSTSEYLLSVSLHKNIENQNRENFTYRLGFSRMSFNNLFNSTADLFTSKYNESLDISLPIEPFPEFIFTSNALSCSTD